MNPFKFGILLPLVLLFAAGRAFTGEPTLKAAEVIELANAAAKAKGVRLTDYDPPTARYERIPKDDTWRVHYQGNVRKPGGFFVISVHDKTKKTKLLPGA